MCISYSEKNYFVGNLSLDYMKSFIICVVKHCEKNISTLIFPLRFTLSKLRLCSLSLLCKYFLVYSSINLRTWKSRCKLFNLMCRPYLYLFPSPLSQIFLDCLSFLLDRAYCTTTIDRLFYYLTSRTRGVHKILNRMLNC
jgi:hypothetical protein